MIEGQRKFKPAEFLSLSLGVTNGSLAPSTCGNKLERVRKAKSFSEHGSSPMFCLEPSDINYSVTRTSECMGLALL